MIRSIAVVAALAALTSCKTSDTADNSNVESSFAGSSTPFKQALTCSGPSNSKFTTFTNGSATFSIGKDQMDMVCTSTGAQPQGMGQKKVGACTSTGKSGYTAELYFSSGITASYQVVAHKGTATPLYLNCAPSAYNRSDDSGDDSNECPQVRSINCMPITTNPDCKPARRSWIRQNCPGVSFLD